MWSLIRPSGRSSLKLMKMKTTSTVLLLGIQFLLVLGMQESEAIMPAVHTLCVIFTKKDCHTVN